MRLRKSQSKIVQPTELPPGSFIKTEKGYFYVATETKRMRFITDRVLASWSPQRIIETTEANAAVAKLRVSSKMMFRNGSLLYSHADGKIYLISNNKRRPLHHGRWLEILDVKRQDIPWVTLDEINLHEEGAPLN